jgi:hypothetical protein
MANGGPDTNSAEFFLTLGDQTRLNYLHSVFGRVVSGGELLSQIKPDEAFSIKILRIGSDAQKFKADEATFKALVAKAKPYRGLDVPGPTAHFDDPDNLLPVSPPRAQGFNYKLANFERATGIKIVARLFSKSPPGAEDKVPGAYMRALAKKFGVAQRGAFVAYFAADEDWRVWVGQRSRAGRCLSRRQGGLFEGGTISGRCRFPRATKSRSGRQTCRRESAAQTSNRCITRWLDFQTRTEVAPRGAFFAARLHP